jgi:co-chaperonin GroES (HSP10)
MTIIPLGDKVIIKPEELPDRTVAGIILAAKRTKDTGTIVAVSKDFEASVSVGQKVRYMPNGAEELEDGNVLISEQSILFIIND